jgi:hypothetical protein
MDKSASIALTCDWCGKEIVLDLPGHCPQFDSAEQNQPQRLICCRCGTELNKGKPIYCVNCCAAAEIDFQQRTNDCQKRTDELQSKLLIIELQKSKLEALLHRNGEIIAKLEQRVSLLESG